MAPSISLATVPLSLYVLGHGRRHLADRRDLAGLWPPRRLHHRHRLGTLTGLLGAFAVLHASFWLFCCATFLGGLYGAVAQSYRFAAADGASAAFRPKAVSWVMAGGVFAGVLGPQLVQWTMDIWPPYMFAFSFAMQAVVALVAMVILWPASMRRSPRRPICMAAVRCSRSCGSRASSPRRSAASSPIPS